jgi:HEAT repeat protein
MRVALAVLDEQAGVHPDAATRSQADVLATRIRGRLAAQGDAAAAERIAETVAPLAPPPPSPPRGVVAPAPAPSAPAAPALAYAQGEADAQGETDLRIAALSALMQMDAERAVPILEQVLARRDAGSVELRRKAVFLVSQKRSPRTEQILLDVARNDPDTEVRAQAVFWLSEVPTEGAVTALDSILQGSPDRQVQEKAIFALSQHRSERASRALRTYVERRDVPEELRSKAIFWLGESHSDENQAFLRGLYDRLQSQELKERVIFSVAQSTNADNHRWLLDLARNASEPIEVRKKALFWAGESGVRISALIGLYDSMSDFELKKQLIFVYSERQETEAVDKLMNIARSDPNPELRRKAVFWLGQSNDPRVAQFLLEIISQ